MLPRAINSGVPNQLVAADAFNNITAYIKLLKLISIKQYQYKQSIARLHVMFDCIVDWEWRWSLSYP